MRFAQILLCGCIVCCLSGCGASKGTQKGSDEQLKTLSTGLGNSGVKLPAEAAGKGDKESMKTGGNTGGAAPGKGGPPPPPR